jgi:hypothetical protein
MSAWTSTDAPRCAPNQGLGILAQRSRGRRDVSIEHYPEARFPKPWRKAYYLMSTHDHLKQIPTPEIEDLGLAKAPELA